MPSKTMLIFSAIVLGYVCLRGLKGMHQVLLLENSAHRVLRTFVGQSGSAMERHSLARKGSDTFFVQSCLKW